MTFEEWWEEGNFECSLTQKEIKRLAWDAAQTERLNQMVFLCEQRAHKHAAASQAACNLAEATVKIARASEAMAIAVIVQGELDGI